MANINEILSAYIQGDKTADETNAALAAAGSKLIVQRGKRPGNALLDIGVGSPEPCKVQNGKLVNAAGTPHTDRVFYQGKWYVVGDDGVTLV